MTTGKEAFESACQIGVAKSYNYRQLSQVFHGIDLAIQEIEINGGGNIVVSGSQPDGTEEGQIAFFQGNDGYYYEYLWVDNSWVNVKTQNNDVTVADSAPFITISGTTLNTQQDINLYLNDKIENLIVDPSGEPIDLEPFATKEYVESGLAEKVSCSGDTMTGRLTIKKDRQDVNSIAFSIAGRIRNNANEIVDDILFKSYQRQNSSDTQADYIVYYGSTGGANEILNRVTAQQEFAAKGTFDVSISGLEQRVSDGEAKQSTIEATVGTALGVQSDIQTEQGVQNNQINLLETQIQLLAQTQAAGKWTYERNISGSVRPPNTATFYGTHSADVTTVLTDWSDLRLIMVDKTDIDGTTYTFSIFEEGDKIEILATDGSSAVFGTVSNNPNNDSYGNMIVTVERSSGGPTEGKEYVLSVYRPGANGGDVDLDVLDGRYVIKTGDTITGNLVLDGGGLYTDSIIKSTRNTGYAFQVKPDDLDPTAYIHTNGNAEFAKVTVEAAPAEATDLANKDYVDEEIEKIVIPDVSNYLPKSGGTMTGDAYIRFSDGGINFKKADDSTKSYFYNASDTVTQLTAYNGTKIVITARDGEPGSGRTFVDIQNSDSNGIGGTDSGYRMKLNHLADPTEDLHAVNKRYVDTASGSKKYPGLRFKFSSGTGAVIGKFNYYDSGGLRLRVSNTSQDYKWNDGGLTVDYSFSEGHRFSIYEKLSDGTLKIIRTGTYNRADYHSGDVLLRVSSHQTNGSFNTSSEYYLCISGLF